MGLGKNSIYVRQSTVKKNIFSFLATELLSIVEFSKKKLSRHPTIAEKINLVSEYSATMVHVTWKNWVFPINDMQTPLPCPL